MSDKRTVTVCGACYADEEGDYGRLVDSLIIEARAARDNASEGGNVEFVDPRKAWDDLADLFDKAIGAIRALARPSPMGESGEKERWQAWARKRLDVQHTNWLRAAKAALNGDMRELRNRVELAEAPPVDIVLSAGEENNDR